MSTYHACVDAKAFSEALMDVSRFAAGESSLPVLSEAMVRFDGSHCVLTCTNLYQWCTATIPATGDAFAFVFTKTKRVLTACRYFAGTLELTFSNKPNDRTPDPDGVIELSDGTHSLQRGTMPASDFPSFPAVSFEDRYDICAGHLLERFKRIRYALSTDMNRKPRCCIEFLDTRIAAVDGYRLAFNHDPALSVKTPFLIPPEAMAALEIFRKRPCTLSVGKMWACFENETLSLLTRIPEKDSFEIDQSIPPNLGMECPVSVNTLWAQVKYLSDLSNAKEKKPVRFDGKTLVLETSDGTYSTQVGLPSIPVRGFNLRYLLEGLSQFKAKKADTVTMKVGSPVSPLILTDGEDELAMILPVRLKAA